MSNNSNGAASSEMDAWRKEVVSPTSRKVEDSFAASEDLSIWKNGITRNRSCVPSIHDIENQRLSMNLAMNLNEAIQTLSSSSSNHFQKKLQRDKQEKKLRGLFQHYVHGDGDGGVGSDASKMIKSTPRSHHPEQNGESNSPQKANRQGRQQEELLDIFEQFLQSPRGQSWFQDLIGSAISPTRSPIISKHGSVLPVNDDSNQAANGLDSAVIEGDFEEKYPPDTYSFIALNGPMSNNGWPLQKMKFFLFGLMPFVFQIFFLVLLVINLDNTDPDLCNRGLDVRMAQIVAMLAYVIFPNSTQQDLIRAIQHFPWCAAETDDIPVGCIRISSILRVIQGHGAVSVVFLLVMKSDSTLDIILNFTAMHFLSDLDDAAFSLARSGVFGPNFREEAKRIAGTKLPRRVQNQRKHIWYGGVMVFYCAVFFTLMAFMIYMKKEFSWTRAALVDTWGGVGVVFLFFSISRCAAHFFCPRCDAKLNCESPSSTAEEVDDSKMERVDISGRTARTQSTIDSTSTSESPSLHQVSLGESHKSWERMSTKEGILEENMEC
jgi:hypothetical protein